MNVKVDKFFIRVKAYNKDYHARHHIIEIPYMLKPGNYVYRLNYTDRGVSWNDCIIKKVAKDYIIVQPLFPKKKRIIKLKYDTEPLYKQTPFCKPWIRGGESRKLCVWPFPTFSQIPDFEKASNLDFYNNQSELRMNFKAYEKNLENILTRQLTMF